MATKQWIKHDGIEILKIWFPYVKAGSGSDVLVRVLCRLLQERGHETVLRELPHMFQYAPSLLRLIKPPPRTDAVITNSWGGLAFHRKNLNSICIEHLFVLDPALQPYKSFAQSIFHQVFVRSFVKQSYRTANHVIAVSQYTADRVKDEYPAVPAKAILNGIDTDFFCPDKQREMAHPSDTPFKLLFVGNLSRRKGADILPDIMGQLGDDYELRYTGGRNDDLPMPSLGNMHPLGRLSAEEMRERYRTSDALIVPTRLEGLSLVVLEALACGLPVISSDSASLPEVIRHQENGMVCPVDDVDAMVAAARYLADNRETLQQMGIDARKSACKYYSAQRMVDEYELLLNSIP